MAAGRRGKSAINQRSASAALTTWEAARSEQYRLKADTLLSVAARHFEERGYAGTSLNDICSELGITNNAVYHYFKSKEDIAFHVLIRSQELIQQCIDKASENPGDGLAKLEAFFGMILESAPDNPPVPVRLSYALTQQHRATTRQNADRHRVSVVRFIEDGISDGSIRLCDPALTVDFLLAGVYALHRRFQSGEAETAVWEVINTVVGGIKARPGAA